MRFHSPMIIVSNIEESKQFYCSLLDEVIEQDLKTYVVFGGGFSMMSKQQWEDLTKSKMQQNLSMSFMFELYFEEDEIDVFISKLSTYEVEVLTPLEEASWGQRAIRFLDPDRHVIEVAESMEAVVKRLLLKGLSIEDVSDKSLMSKDFVKKILSEIAQ